MMSSLIRSAVLGAFLVVSAAFAQTTFATITGSVTDPNGLAAPGVELSATNTATGYVYNAQTNAAGIYTITQLPPGPYTLRARLDGFKEFVGTQVDLLSRDIKTIDVKLEVGSVATTVEVTAGGALIETETARMIQTSTSRELNTVPVLQRRMQEFMPIIPTVTVQSGVMHFAGSLYNNQNVWTVDGNYIGGIPGTVLNFIEGVSEVRVNAGNATADQSGLAHVSVVSKSGTNELHGSAFDYYSSSNWSARNPFAAGGTGSVAHNVGGSLGGPVYIPKVYDGRNRTFFFQTYESNQGGMPRTAMNSTVPLEAWREGDFSKLATAIKDPLTGQAFPGNVVPESRLNSVSLKLQDEFYPLPNYGDTGVFMTNNLRNVLTRPLPATYMVTSRLDHRITDKHFIYGRYSYSYQGGGGQDGNLPTIGLWYRDLKNWSWGVTESWTVRPDLINEIRYGLLYQEGPQYGVRSGKEMVEKLGLQGLAPDLPDLPGIFGVSFSNVAISPISQSVYHNPFQQTSNHQIQDTVSWFHGKHSLKFGTSINLNYFEDRPVANALYGQTTFSNRFTNHAYADFLLGYPTTMSRSFPRDIVNRNRIAWDFFITDNIKLTRSLTLDLGLRYENHPTSVETNQMSSMFDINSGNIVVPDGGLARVSPFFPSNYVGIVEASSVGLDSKTILSSPKMNLAPRLGVAWRPFGNQTVFRVGYGIYYDVNPAQVLAGGVPFVLDEPAYTNPVDNPVVFPRVFPVTSIGGPGTISIPKAYRGDLRMPYSMQYTVSIEHERWGNAFHLSYIGTNLRQGLYDININQPVADANLFINKSRAFPKYPAIRYASNGAGHQYNALVFKVDRRFRNGLSYEYSFTWARDIGDAAGGPLEDNPRLLENAYDRARDIGPVYDVPGRRHTAQVIYDLPFGRKRPLFSDMPRALDAIFGGWQLAGVLTTHSGQYMTPMWTGPDPTGTAFTGSSTPAQITIRPDRIADGNLPDSVRSVDRWFDVGAFTAPQKGNFGTSGNGILIGPPTFALRGALSKTFVLWEQVKLNAAVQSSNVLNHPNYSPPGLNISQQSAGVINGIGNSTDTEQSGRRALRTMLRLEW